MSQHLATISQLYVYPVKSMSGVPLQEAHVGLDGIIGDRQYAFVRADQAAKNSFPWMTARELTRMLLYHPEFSELPTPANPEPAVRVRTPSGATHPANDPALRDELARELKQELFLLKSARGIFDCQHVSLFSLASARALAERAGSIDPRQFRANIYMEPVSAQPFDEESWTGLLRIGAQVMTGVTQRDPRCMMINLDPETAQQNPNVLRTVVQAHDGQAGLYANVVRPGVIKVGDKIELVETS